MKAPFPSVNFTLQLDYQIIKYQFMKNHKVPIYEEAGSLFHVTSGI